MTRNHPNDVSVLQTPDDVQETMEAHLSVCETRCLVAVARADFDAVLPSLRTRDRQLRGLYPRPEQMQARQTLAQQRQSTLQDVESAIEMCKQEYTFAFWSSVKSPPVVTWLQRFRTCVQWASPDDNPEAVHILVFKKQLEMLRERVVTAIRQYYAFLRTSIHNGARLAWGPYPGNSLPWDLHQERETRALRCRGAIQSAFDDLNCLMEILVSV